MAPAIIYGHLAMTDFSFGFVSFDGKTWALDEEAVKEHFCNISNAGASAVRILPYAVWEERPHGRKSQFCPWVLGADNLWDLARFNEYYFPIMRRLFEIINSYNMTVWFPLFDNCQQQPGYWNKYSPWMHNSNGVSSFYDEAADKHCAAWVKRCFKEFSGLNMFWPWGNELADRKPALEWTRRVIFPLIKELKIPYDRMTYGFTMGEVPYLGKGEFADGPYTIQDTARKYFGMDFPPEKNKLLLLREVHKCGTLKLDDSCPYGHRPAQAGYWWGPRRAVGPWLLSDDGVHECNNPKDGGRPDAARWKAMATWALGLANYPSFEHLPEGGDLDYQVGVIKAISKAYRDWHPKHEWPENYGKWPYVPPPPPPVEYVTVKVCKTSVLLPNAYCPTVIEKKYIKGQEPTKACAVHKKPDEPPPPGPDPDPEPPNPEPSPDPEPVPPHPWMKDNWGWVAAAILAVIALAFLL